MEVESNGRTILIDDCKAEPGSDSLNQPSTVAALGTGDCGQPSSENECRESVDMEGNVQEGGDTKQTAPLVTDAIERVNQNSAAGKIAGPVSSGRASDAIAVDFVKEDLDAVEEEDEDVDMENVSNASSMGSSYVEIEEENQKGSKGRLYDSFDWTSEAVLQDADGAIAFNMSLQERLLELHDIFENFGQGGLCLTNLWTLYFETYIEPMGWLALWKQKEDDDDKFLPNTSVSSGNYKNIEKVEVTQVNCATLSARVKKADGSIVWALLKDLYPMGEQENSFLSMKITAKCIDNYRFFLNHLLFPWDSENADRWMELHLESRVQFYYDLQAGSISESMSKEIHNLIYEARVNQKKIETLEEKLSAIDEEEDFVEEPLVAEMLPIHMRQDEIKSRLTILENPMWRNIISKQKISRKQAMSSVGEKVILVHPNGSSITQLRRYLDYIAELVGAEETIRILPSLEDALDCCESNTKIYLNPGTHRIPGLGSLESGGQISGIPGLDQNEQVIIEPKDSGDVWLVVNTEGSVKVENATIRVTKKWTLPSTENDVGNLSLIEEPASSITFLISKGELSLSNVKLEGFLATEGLGSGEQETTGIKGLNEGKVSLSNCSIKHFITGVAVREDAQLVMKTCDISDCRMGVEINAGVLLNMNCVKIERCQKFGILIFSRSDTATVLGSSELLHSPLIAKTGVQIADLNIKDCLAGEICVCNEASYEEKEATEPECENKKETTV